LDAESHEDTEETDYTEDSDVIEDFILTSSGVPVVLDYGKLVMFKP
jgi:hypothetical protein